MEEYNHKPVLLSETLNFLKIEKGKTYVDCTTGLGGHSTEILKALDGTGLLIGIEQDKEAYEIAKNKFQSFNNYKIFNKNFIEIKDILRDLNLPLISGGLILDLGVSSLQLDKADRGFSFSKEGRLDMRMDQGQELSAEYVVNRYSEEEIANIIYKYGEERLSRRIAHNIVKSRPIYTTSKLAEIVLKAFYGQKRTKIHPATRTFQALRIFVNDELENLEKFLCMIQEHISYKGRLICISFHSMEDRIVKNSLKNIKEFSVLTKKPITPSVEEIKYNPRARSAKLRAAEKINYEQNK